MEVEKQIVKKIDTKSGEYSYPVRYKILQLGALAYSKAKMIKQIQVFALREYQFWDVF